METITDTTQELAAALATIADQQLQITRLQQDAVELREQNAELLKHKEALRLVRSALNDAGIEHSGYDFNQWERVNLLVRRDRDRADLAKRQVIRAKGLAKEKAALEAELNAARDRAYNLLMQSHSSADVPAPKKRFGSDEVLT